MFCPRPLHETIELDTLLVAFPFYFKGEDLVRSLRNTLSNTRKCRGVTAQIHNGPGLQVRSRGLPEPRCEAPPSESGTVRKVRVYSLLATLIVVGW